MTKSDIDSLIELKIIDIGAEGKAIGKIDEDFVIFVDNGVPGDVVKARIKKVKINYAEAKCEEILTNSIHRIEPRCEYFGVCNGCRTQNIDYNYQLELKRNTVKNAFSRIGGFKDIDIPPVIGSESIFYYRNKLEFSFSANRWLTSDDMDKEIADKKFALGYHIPNFIDKVLDVHNCYLQSETSVKIVNLTRDFFKQRNESIYSTKTHSGYLRFLVIRQSPITKEI